MSWSWINSDLHSNKLYNFDDVPMFADHKADGWDDSDEDDSELESDEEGHAPRFNFVGSYQQAKPICPPELQQFAARQQKERDKDDSKAGGDKILFFCLPFFWFFSPVFLVFCGVGDDDYTKKMVVLWEFLFFCGGGCDDDYNAIIDCNLKTRFCIAVCNALLRE